MAFRRLLGRPQSTAPQSESLANDYDVYPLHRLDVISGNRKLVGWVMLFNDVLDAEKLNGALSKLMGIGDWRKFGGRLKRREDGHLEIHTPHEFNSETPAITFTRDERPGVDIKDDPVASRLPTTHSASLTQPIDPQLASFQVPPDYPESLDTMIDRGCPVISLHVTSFQDATVVGVAWPHVLMDAAVYTVMLQAWSSILAGREADVPPVMGAKSDVLLEMEKQHAAASGGHEMPVIEEKRLKGHRLMRVVGKYLWEKSQSSDMETRAVCLPRALCDKLVNQVKAEVVDLVGHEEKSGTEPKFVGEDDVLTAWSARALSLAESSPRPLAIAHLCSVRHRVNKLPKHMREGTYLQTMLGMSCTFLSSSEATGPIAFIALSNRRHVAKQTTQAQMLGLTHWLRSNTSSNGDKGPALIYADSVDSLVLTVNPLTKLDMFGAVDFGPAVVRPGKRGEAQKNPPGTMVSYYNQPVRKPLEWLNAFYTLGRDRDGNCWLLGHFLPKTWQRIEDEIQQLMEGAATMENPVRQADAVVISG